ncbi:hypothetical protein HMPREF9389_2301 [Streptococcus sanguinis SK355]|uniref:Uncharacterized protein n=1 Tax=Streptococcus sanguinis SK355 TaxID=888816 RepID=F3UTZ3_STRSA|nr:hypothetical protein HMPREF9389_2301 [Streptococcus sanguinis SK355]
MSRPRSATNTIKGYFYQFDKSILEILEQSNETNIVTIEGVEDIDIEIVMKYNLFNVNIMKKLSLITVL